MEKIRDIRLPVRLTSDIDYLAISPESTNYKLNLRAFSPEGAMGYNVNIDGTTEFGDVASIGSANELVGWCKDVKNKSIILFLEAHAPGDDRIMRYNIETGVLDLILESSYLNFHGHVEADVVGDMLYWTDGYFNSFLDNDFNPPRKINMVTLVSTIDFVTLDAGKAPPLLPLTVSYKSNATINRNYLRGRLYQFRYQYVYVDEEKSSWSSVSKCPLPANESAANGTFYQLENVNNYIEVIYGSVPDGIRAVNFAYRVGNNGHWKQFRTVNEIDVTGILDFYGDDVAYALDQEEVERLYHDIPIVSKKQRFIDGKNLVYANYYAGSDNVDNVELTLSLIRSDVNYEYISISAFLTLGDAFINIHILEPFFLGGIVSFYLKWDNDAGDHFIESFFYVIKLGDTLVDVQNAIIDWLNDNYGAGFAIIYGINTDWIHLGGSELSDFTIISAEATYGDNPGTTSKTFKAGSNVEVGLVYSDRLNRSGGVQGSVSIYVPYFTEYNSSAVYDSPTLQKTNIDVNINHDPPEWATEYQVVVSTKRKVFIEYLVNSFERLVSDGQVKIRLNDSIQDGIASNKAVTYGYYDFKKGDRLRIIGIQYYDSPVAAHLIGGVNALSSYADWKIILDGSFRITVDGTEKDIVGLNFSSVNSMDNVATLLQAAIGLATVIWSVDHFVITSVGQPMLSSISATNTSNGFVGTDISGVVAGYMDCNSVDGIFPAYSINRIEYVSKFYDVEILGVEYDTGATSYEIDDSEEDDSYIVDVNSNKIKKDTAQYLLVSDFDFEAEGLDDNQVLIEVYTPENADNDENVFYEVGECYDITAPHTINRAHSVNDIEIEGDIFIRTRTKNALYSFMCEDIHFSDVYVSDVWDRGRANVYNENAKSRWYGEYLKHSKSYFKNSYNGLSDFDSIQINLSSKDGEITDMREVGYRLNLKQAMKDSSVYIGRSMLTQPDGSSQLVATDRLLGTINPSEFDYGTVFPKSVVQHASHVYYFDVYNGAMIRDSYNGPIQISQYGMVTYFKGKADKILAAGIDNCDVVCSYDGKYDELNVTFNINGGKETVVFHESQIKEERVWSHYASYTPDNYAYFGDTLIAIDNNKLWKHNSGIKNNFYDIQYDSIVGLIFNKHSLKNKIFQSIQIKGVGSWVTKDHGDVYILDESGAVTKSSYLPYSKYDAKEDAVYATFLKNALHNGVFSVQKLINGEVMRGRFLVVKLTNESTDKAWLSHVVVNSISSELS